METAFTEPIIEPRVLKLGAAALNADELHVSSWQREERTVQTLVSHGTSWDQETYRLADYPLTELVLHTALPQQILAGDPGADPAEVALLEELGGFRALLMLPVTLGGETVGLLEAYRLSEMGWTRDEISRALAFGRQIAPRLRTI